ncbi:MAG: OmpH family outer membrane protein [Bacteroidaceae bacterium]|nr:OmpH family outer membrane protein [Bacteroidaceae bacterium]
MKKILLMLALLSAPLVMSAQQFAHFSLADVMQALPDWRNAVTELQAIGQQYSNDLQAMREEIQTKIDKYQKEVTEATPPNIRERREQEIIQLRERYEQAQEDNTNNYQQQQQQKMEPIQKKILDAVNLVARNGNYVYVVDKSAAQQNNMIVNEALSTDVTSKIMEALGITPEDIAAGKAFVTRMQQEAQQQPAQQPAQ